MNNIYECLIVGAGIAGLQAAIQLGRYRRKVIVIDSGEGRSSLCRSYRNILGWPDGISGEELRTLGKAQAEETGVHFFSGRVVRLKKAGNAFEAETASGAVYYAKRVLLSTGLSDRMPELPGLKACLGLSVYVCPDCDGYEVRDKKTIVLGAGAAGANMALTLSYWTDSIVYVNHEQQSIPEDLILKLQHKGIISVDKKADEVLTENGSVFKGIRFADGTLLEGDCGFLAFGGNTVHTGLAAMLGAERLENKHVLTNPRTKETSVKHVWAAGDAGVHSEQVTIAMGEGCQAAVWIHKSLMDGE
ncbi:NAD(P)/FAD-dependent oxidoreductase [Metabacillus sp. JX24]|uniref:NAD(P)/FAD-dependent oxidoreductase n=1 Tax=Metabacillus sp. JX24 TaxID=3240759 RepID=UPI00350F192C